jgi:hypothetical protein
MLAPVSDTDVLFSLDNVSFAVDGRVLLKPLSLSLSKRRTYRMPMGTVAHPDGGMPISFAH